MERGGVFNVYSLLEEKYRTYSDRGIMSEFYESVISLAVAKFLLVRENMHAHYLGTIAFIKHFLCRNMEFEE